MLKTVATGNLRADRMANDPGVTPRKPRRKGGRPSRAEASAKALLGVDLTAVDPVAILRAIAADRSAPASARVSAAKALLGLRDQDPAEAAIAGDAISVRAQQLLAARRAN
jgi:hypothetical protein